MAVGSPPRALAQGSKKDPRVRKDKTCVVCGKPLTALSITHNDPFCSTPCARKYHGAELNSTASTS